MARRRAVIPGRSRDGGGDLFNGCSRRTRGSLERLQQLGYRPEEFGALERGGRGAEQVVPDRHKRRRPSGNAAGGASPAERGAGPANAEEVRRGAPVLLASARDRLASFRAGARLDRLRPPLRRTVPPRRGQHYGGHRLVYEGVRDLRWQGSRSLPCGDAGGAHQGAAETSARPGENGARAADHGGGASSATSHRGCGGKLGADADRGDDYRASGF
mmetsp:Transcript_59477/g.166102  ORF Transcript_59477/g.166102 Transcript_59477/m.166102 type:complete len:216 (-) Transcript_59477:77-724(-)